MLQVPDDWMIPVYDDDSNAGHTIANVPSTVAALLGVSFDGLPPLEEALWQPLRQNGDVRRVIVLILDALGQNLIEQMAERLQPILDKTAVCETITSVYPSTTVNCLSCLWTGQAPAQHGLIGLHLYLPELSTVGQMIHMTPAFVRLPDALVRGGLEPEAFLLAPGVGTQLATAGIASYAFKGREIADTALSKMHDRGVTGNYGAVTFADMLWQIRQLLEAKPHERLYACGYWPTIDTLSHCYTPQSAVVHSEAKALFQQIDDILLCGLSPRARRETVLLIVADHGQIPIPREKHYIVDQEMQKWLLINGAGEARNPYLYARQGQKESLLAYLQETCSEAMLPVTAAEVLKSGLLGPPPYHEAVALRLGDIVGLMKTGYVLWPSEQVAEIYMGRFLATHGGLSKEEMSVPWLGFCL